MSGRVGIDIGATAIRVAEVAGLDKDSFARVSRAATVPLPSGAVMAGKVVDSGAVAHALKEALRQAKLSGYGAVVGLASPETAVARVAMPVAVKPSEWVSVLRTAEKPISPRIPIAKSRLSSYNTGEGPEDPAAPSNVLLVAAALDDELDTLVSTLRRAGVTARAIDLAGAATMRCMVRSRPVGADVSTLVDIGASKITIATRRGLHLRSLRTIDGGGERITRALMGATGLPFEQADELKRTMRLDSGVLTKKHSKAAEVASVYGSLEETSVHAPDDGTRPMEALITATDVLLDDIARAVEADAMAHDGAETGQLMLCGGTALMQGLKDRLIKHIGISAMVSRPWARLLAPKKSGLITADSPDEALVLHSLATAIGLAMWKENQ